MNDEINDLRIDIRDRYELESAIVDAEPDFVFHLAAQALVRSSYDDPIDTWNTNTMGTLHVLEALAEAKEEMLCGYYYE